MGDTKTRRHRGVGLTLMAAAAIAAPALAGQINSATMFGPMAGTGPGLGTVSVPGIFTIQVNNDNVPAPQVLDNNLIIPIKRFDFNDYIDIEFLVAPTQGVTEYQAFESVDNNTGVQWAGYRMELGHGVGAAFIPSIAGDGLDFDFPNYDLPPTSTIFPVVGTPTEDTLVFSGGIQGAGAESFQIRIDVPDIPTITPFFSRFTLRQTPIAVPEPAAATLLGLALAGLAARRSRR